jgi:predicted ArsR family transcriptional regulator
MGVVPSAPAGQDPAATDGGTVSDIPPQSGSLADHRHVALAAPSRRRLLNALRTAAQPMDVMALAAAVGLHVTTARGHLALLERAGLVRRAQDASGGPGRPRQLYILEAEAQPVDDGHRQLADLLAGVLAADRESGHERAEEAGRRWAETQVPGGRRLSWDDAVGEVLQLFAVLGFAPRPTDVAGRRRIDLVDCPFRDVARAYPGIVCAVHRGLLRESLARLGQEVVAADATLQPFVEPELCVVGIPFPSADGDRMPPRHS